MSEIYPLMLEPLAREPIPHPELAQEVDRVLLEHPGPDPMLDVFPAASLQDGRLDSRTGKQQRERESCRPGPDDADLRAHHPAIPTRVRSSVRSLDRVLARELLDGDPAQLGELLERSSAAEAAPPTGFDPTEWHLRFVMDGGVVHMTHAGLDALGELECPRHVPAEDSR